MKRLNPLLAGLSLYFLGSNCSLETSCSNNKIQQEAPIIYNSYMSGFTALGDNFRFRYVIRTNYFSEMCTLEIYDKLNVLDAHNTIILEDPGCDGSVERINEMNINVAGEEIFSLANQVIGKYYQLIKFEEKKKELTGLERLKDRLERQLDEE